MPFTHTHLTEVERIGNAGLVWRPIRRTLGVTGFGINGYTGDQAGDVLIEAHDETSPGAGGHEELYHALAGDRDDALRHLHVAFANDPRTREWAAEDDDLITVRDDPSLARPRLRQTGIG